MKNAQVIRVECDMTRTLVVDDDAMITRIFRRILLTGLPAMTVDVASNGLEALESFGRMHQGVLIMDLRMPVMDGRTAFREIEKMCEQRGWKMPSVVFCAAYAPPDIMEKILESNPTNSLLIKPVGYDGIIDAVRRVLRAA